MKIRIMSDLHTEGLRGRALSTFSWATYNGEDVLVLAGDIAVGMIPTADVIRQFLDLGFPRIIYVMGNHENYHHSYEDLMYFAPDLRSELNDPRVTVLNCHEVLTIEDVAFFGGTLWTNFDNDNTVMEVSKTFINDFKVIDGFTPARAAAINLTQAQYIKHMYEQISGKKVIITHFMPARECVHPRWQGSATTNMLNGYFSNDLGSWIKTLTNTTWIYGHTHDPADFMLGNTRMVCNPRGYTNENRPDDWNPNKVIEL